MKNIEKYYDQIKKAIAKDGRENTNCLIYSFRNGSINCDRSCNSCGFKNIVWLNQECSEDILNSEEKSIIKQLVNHYKLYGHTIRSIYKSKTEKNRDYICLLTDESYNHEVAFLCIDYYMFKNLELDVEYNIEDLGLETGDKNEEH